MAGAKLERKKKAFETCILFSEKMKTTFMAWKFKRQERLEIFAFKELADREL